MPCGMKEVDRYVCVYICIAYLWKDAEEIQQGGI
jgi:hypothetical protein